MIAITTTATTGWSKFSNNHANGSGGAVYTIGSTFTAIFSHNKADIGAGICIIATRINILGRLTLSQNLAYTGAGIYLEAAFAQVIVHSTAELNFIGNIARDKGGGLRMGGSSTNKMIIRGNFVNNIAGICGGAVSIEKVTSRASLCRETQVLQFVCQTPL